MKLLGNRENAVFLAKMSLTPPARPRTAVWGCIIEGRTAITTPPKPL